MKIAIKDGRRITIVGKKVWNGFYAGTAADGEKMLDVKVTLDGEYLAGAEAGYLSESYGGGLCVFNIHVEEAFRRLGVASAIYDYVSSSYGGNPVRPYPGNEGGAIRHFWHNRLSSVPDLLALYASDIGPLPATDKP